MILTNLEALGLQRRDLKHRMAELWDEGERLQALGIPSLEVAHRLVEFKRQQVMRDAADPSWPEHFAELEVVLSFLAEGAVVRRDVGMEP